MLTPQSLPWTEPLDLARKVDEPYWALLYSSTRTNYSGRYSYLACQLAERVEGDDFSTLEKRLQGAKAESPLENAWFGMLGYGLKHCLETLPPDRPNWLSLPALCMMRFHHIYQFDHQQHTLTLWSDMPHKPLQRAETLPDIPYRGYMPPRLKSFGSPMSEAEYLQKAALVIERIHQGDLYQANLTRKFTGEFEESPDYLGIFSRLCEASPAPYSAFLRLGDTYMLSSSPEQFLNIDAGGHIETRPIKGTAPRFKDTARDHASRAALAASAKDKAENLMITDLMRNDLARTCAPGSIRAQPLFEITSHATIHHMSSTVSGQKAPHYSTLDAIKACFPPGSMTGAPKIKAMKLCSELEQLERGVYSGAIGWLGGDGSCDLSVVIRTLVMQGAKFEFQVGGGIVADSTPEAELHETWLKANGILAALGVENRNINFPIYALNA